MKRPLVFTVAICFVLIGQSVMSAPIVYSWEGTIEPRDPNVDPWNIGAEKPYFVAISVDENAVDGGAAIDVAGFDTLDVVFLIDGAPPTSFGRVPISFTFSELATRDTIDVFLDRIRFNGADDDLLLAVSLPTSTFNFANGVEAPPLFPPTLTSVGVGSRRGDSSYRTLTDAGVLVTATRIPEPSTLVLAMVALSVLGTRLFWRKVDCARRKIAAAL